MFKINKQAVVACGLGHRNDFNTRDEPHSKSLQISMSAVVINVGKKGPHRAQPAAADLEAEIVVVWKGHDGDGLRARTRSAVDQGTVCRGKGNTSVVSCPTSGSLRFRRPDCPLN